MIRNFEDPSASADNINFDRVRRYYVEGLNLLRLLRIACERPTDRAIAFERPTCNLPADVIVQGVYYDHDRRSFVLQIQSASFEIHAPGEIMPVHGPLGLEFEIVRFDDIDRLKAENDQLRAEIADLKLQIEALV